MGRGHWCHRRFSAQGAVLPDAGGIRQGDHAGQAGDEEHVRVSGLQDQDERSYVHLDVQSQDPREAHKVDPGRRRDSPTDLNPLFFSVHTRFRARNSFLFFYLFYAPLRMSRNGKSRRDHGFPVNNLLAITSNPLRVTVESRSGDNYNARIRIITIGVYASVITRISL